MPRRGRALDLKWQFLVPFAAVLIGFALVVQPVLLTVVRSLLDKSGAPTIAHYVKLFALRSFDIAVLNTAIAGLAVTLASCVLGCVLAWIVFRTDCPGRRTFGVLNLVPFFLSPYVGAISWLYLLAPNAGIIPRLLQPYLGPAANSLNIYSVGGVIFVLALFYTPYIYLLVSAPLRAMDGALEDAARVHGASFFQLLRYIAIPLLSPALLSGALIVFVTSSGLVDVPLALATPKGIPMVPTEILRAMEYPADMEQAAAIGTCMMLVTVIVALVQQRYLASKKFYTMTGKGYRPRVHALSRGGKIAGLAVEIAYIGAAVVLPLAALLMVAFSALWTGTFRFAGATLAHFHYVLFESSLTQHAITNSIFLAVTGATIGIVLGGLQAYSLGRSTRVARFFELILTLPLAIPGIILGLGVLIALIRTPLYATLGIMLVAYVTHFFPLAMRNTSAMLLTLNPELEESARASGATWMQTIRYVMLPLLKPAMIASWITLFVIFIRELGASILLYAPGTETISVTLVILAERSAGAVAALAVVQVALLLSAFFAAEWLGAPLLGKPAT